MAGASVILSSINLKYFLHCDVSKSIFLPTWVNIDTCSLWIQSWYIYCFLFSSVSDDELLSWPLCILSSLHCSARGSRKVTDSLFNTLPHNQAFRTLSRRGVHFHNVWPSTRGWETQIKLTRYNDMTSPPRRDKRLWYHHPSCPSAVRYMLKNKDWLSRKQSS